VGSLVGKLDQAEMARALVRHPESLDAYGLYLRGVEVSRYLTPEDNAKARDLFERAIALDSNYARAYTELAWCHFRDWAHGWLPGKPKEPFQKALDLAYKAVALDPRDSYGHTALGYILLYGRKQHQGMTHLEEGHKLNPNDADLLVFWAEAIGFTGKPEEAVRRVKEAVRLNPYYPNWYLWFLGCWQYSARDYEGSVETLRQMSPIGVARRFLAASLARLGRMEEAHAEAERFLKDNPTFSATYWGNNQPYLDDKERQHVVEGYIKAGLPR